MKERPILFSAPMVRAILEGRKTQTRRVVKPQPNIHGSFARMYVRKHPFSPSVLKGTAADGTGLKEDRFAWCGEDAWGNEIGLSELNFCPLKYGQPGDLLWVRETWMEFMNRAWYAENPPFVFGKKYEGPWRPSIHMPRWASRITLEITGVRVERLQDISDNDAKREGCSLSAKALDIRHAFRNLWEEINGEESWDANPWVWVVEFKHLKP